MFIMMNIGQNVKSLRLRAGLTQREVSARANLSHSFICQIEKGRHPSVGAAALQNIARALGVDINDLLKSASAS